MGRWTVMGARRGWVAATALGMFAAGCDDGGSDVHVLATALVVERGPVSMARLELIGATDWQAAGRDPRELNVLIDGEPVGFELGDEAIVTLEGSGVGFSVEAGAKSITLAKGKRVVWDFGVHDLEAGRVTTLIYYGSPSEPRFLALADPEDVPDGHAPARLVNLDDTRAPVDALLCPEAAETADACEVVAAGLAYGEAWSGTIATADRKVLLWERAAPADYPLDRFVGGDARAVGDSSCRTEALRRTATVIPVHVFTPETSPSCAYCTSGWSFGDGRAPGDCAW